MDMENLRKFWSHSDVSESFYYDPPEAWEGRDPADYHVYVMEYSYEFQLCHSLGIDGSNFLSKCMMDELDEGEVIRDATE